MEWISVEDELPEYGVDVLVYCHDENSDGYSRYPAMAARYQKGGWHVYGNDTGNPTHWMPLPEPPK